MKKWLFLLLLVGHVYDAMSQIGRVGINTTSPLAMLHVKDSSVVFTGPSSTSLAGNTPVTGPGIRMMWFANKAAFRAGSVNGADWDKDSIGLYSVAMGQNTKAKSTGTVSIGKDNTAIQLGSLALGLNSFASGLQSIAIGSHNIATGDNTTAIGGYCTATTFGSIGLGYYSEATGGHSFAGGNFTTAKGDHSTALGYGVNARSYYSFIVGSYNDTTNMTSLNSWVLTDPIFEVGNGTGAYTRSNAITILKNGNVGIGPVVTPQHRLHITSNFSGNGGWTDGLMVENINATAGEAAISLKNSTLPENKQWIVGLNQGSPLSFNYGSSFATANTQMLLDTSGNLGIGNTSPTHQLQLSLNDAAKPTSSSWTVASDQRLKTNIHDYKEGLNALLKIHPVWFTYTGEAGMPKETGVGVLAQELKEIAPYMVGHWNYHDENGEPTDYLSVDNGAMTYMMINGMKEQQRMIDDLKKSNEAQKEIIEKQQEEIDDLKKSNEAQKEINEKQQAEIDLILKMLQEKANHD